MNGPESSQHNGRKPILLKKMLSSNQENYMRLNRYENNKHRHVAKLLHKEHLFTLNMINSTAFSLYKFNQDIILNSTGTIFNPEEITEDMQKDATPVKGKSVLSNRWLTTISGNSNQILNDSQNSCSKPNQQVRKLSPEAAETAVDAEEEAASSLFKDLTDERFKSRINKFVDKTNLTRYRAQDLKMMPIPSRNTAFHKIEEFDHYRSQYLRSDPFYQMNAFGDLAGLKSLEFRDMAMYGEYVKLCELRDSIALLPPERIKILKEHDQIFSKRYKEYLRFRSRYKAPVFDPDDRLHLPLLSKQSMDMQKNKYRKLNEAKAREARHRPKLDMTPIFNKTREFLKSIDGSTFY